MHPVMSHGGNVCCQGNALAGGALDQREMEQRPDILVYTTEPLKEGDGAERTDGVRRSISHRIGRTPTSP